MGTSDRGVIFPSGDAYYSEPFDLIKDLGMVSIIGLQDGDVAHVEIFIGDSCHGEWVPFSISCCGQMGINAPVNQMFLVVPNKYRLVFSNEAGQHLTDPSWFENVKAFYKIVESDLDLSNLAKGDCDMVCKETAAPSSAQADFDGIKIGSHVSGNGIVTEFDIPVIKRNGQNLPITVDPDTGKAFIDIIDENTDTDNFITDLTINGDTITAVRSDGVTFPITITHPTPPTDNFITDLTINGDTITAVRSDGVNFPVTITHPTPPAPTDPETDGVHLDGSVAPVIDLVAQTITYATLNDLDETPAAPLVQDISALIAALTSAPPPSIIGGSNVTVTTNANGDWVISVPNATVDTDTDTYNTFELQPDGSTLVTEVDINGNPTGNTYTIAGSQQVANVLASAGDTEAAVETANPLLPDGAVVTWTDADGCARRSYKDTAGNWQHPCNLTFQPIPATTIVSLTGPVNIPITPVDLNGIVTVPDCAVFAEVYAQCNIENGVAGLDATALVWHGGGAGDIAVLSNAASDNTLSAADGSQGLVEMDNGVINYSASLTGNATYGAIFYLLGFWVKS